MTVYIVNVYPYYDLEVFDTYSKAFKFLMEIAEENNWTYLKPTEEFLASNDKIYRVITKEVK